MFQPGGKPILTVTEKAAVQVERLMASARRAGKTPLGVRVGVKKGGCSGMTYVVEYAEEQKKFEEVVEAGGAKVFIDPMATMFLLGSEMDYEETKFRSGFTFSNPNEADRCGCGESFSVKPGVQD
ncbi:MAG: iron-sulfur cluster assembly accessory protein [Pseudomonadota bacterium]|nr:iron-sulfur cluster assembly accessory protein [Pseudomonadota bacterium]